MPDKHSFSPASVALIVSAVVFSALIYWFVNENMFKPGIRKLPVETPATEQPQPTPQSAPEAPDNKPETTSLKDLDLSLEQVVEVDEPPFFQPPDENEVTMELHEQESRIHVSGDVFLKDDADLSHQGMHAIDGGEIKLRVDVD